MTTFDTRRLAQATSLATLEQGNPRTTPCFGVGCALHGACASYQAIEGADPEAKRIGTCASGAERPMFVRLSERRSVK